MNNIESLLVFIDTSNSGEEQHPLAKYRWSFVYADGLLESDFGYDIVLFNKEMPTEEGYFIAIAENNKTVVINLVADENGNLKGRCSYINDYESLDHINSPEEWA